jgi:FtsZ-binding cell division protein ZapB
LAKVALVEAEITNLKEDNDALVAQRKTLTRANESLTKDLEKLKREKDG